MTQSALIFNVSATPLQAALTYAARGWPVFPCHSMQPKTGACTCGAASCSSRAKHPATRQGFKDATTDLARVREIWARLPAANVGVVTGRASGLVVLDVDPDHGGLSSLRSLIVEHGRLPDTMTVGTGSDGLHFYFAHPGNEIRNSAGSKLGPGLDVRGDGGYVIAPPSGHASGRDYRWATDLDTEVAQLPDWMHAALRPPERRQMADVVDIRSGARVDAWARRALDAEVASVVGAPEGARNHLLNRAAFNLGQIVAGGSLQHDDVERALRGAGFAVGLSDRECEATIRSGMTAGEARPRGPSQRSPSLRRPSEVEVEVLP